METKKCNTCEKEKPATIEFFSRSRDRPDGLQYRCKECAADYYKANREHIGNRTRAHYEANKEQKNEYAREWYQTNKSRRNEQIRAYHEANSERRAEYLRAYKIANRERLAKKARAYREANKELQSERSHARYIANKEHISKRVRAYYRANPEKARVFKLRYRALKAQAEGRHTAEDIKAQYVRQKKRCYWCECKLSATYHVDHIVPLSRGGSNWPENLVIACPSCNSSKKDKLPHEWLQGGRLL